MSDYRFGWADTHTESYRAVGIAVEQVTARSTLFWTRLFFRTGPISNIAGTPPFISETMVPHTAALSSPTQWSNTVLHPFARQMATELLWDNPFHPLRLYLADREKQGDGFCGKNHKALYSPGSGLRKESAPWTGVNWCGCRRAGRLWWVTPARRHRAQHRGEAAGLSMVLPFKQVPSTSRCAHWGTRSCLNPSCLMGNH